MKFTKYTDYSIRTLIYLGLNTSKLSRIKDIAAAYDISENHLMKIVHHLGQKGYITTLRGRNGGLQLAQEAKEIRLGTLVKSLEGDRPLIDIADMDHPSQLIPNSCGLSGFLAEAMGAFFTSLDQYTLFDLLDNNMDLARHLGIDVNLPTEAENPKAA